MAEGDVVSRETGKEAAATTEYRHPVMALQREMDRLFGEFFGDRAFPSLGWARGGGRLVPDIDVSESDAAFEISVELPGIDEKDIHVSLAEGALTIQGEKKEETEQKEKTYYRSERSYGMFKRVIPLAAVVDESRIKATYDKGVLTVHLPKAPDSAPKVKKIEIGSGK